MNNSKVSFTMNANDAFVGLQLLTEHYFNGKRKKNPDCLFNLHLVCNDAKARKIGYKHKKVHARNTLEREEAKEKERATKKRNPYFHNPNGGDA